MSRNAAWTEAFVEQITTFPNARHDDMCDMMTQAAAWLLQHRGRGWQVTDAFSGRVIYDCTY
jgi:phage terminase large subunit-like protein